jgi:phasin family protein
MFNFPESSISQAVKSQMDAQFSFFAQFSEKMLDGAQKLNELNMQVTKSMMEESLARTQQFLTSNDQSKFTIPQGQALPAADKIRGYQQNVQNIVAETQASIARIVETHLPATARGAEAIVREVTQRASEDTVKATQRQKEALEKFVVPASQAAERAAQASASKPTH